MAAPIARARDKACAPRRQRLRPAGVRPVVPAGPRTARGGPSLARALSGSPPPPQSLRGACRRLMCLAQATPPSSRRGPDKDTAEGPCAVCRDLPFAALPRRPGSEPGLPGDYGGRRGVAAAGGGFAAPSEPSVQPSPWHLGEWRGRGWGRKDVVDRWRMQRLSELLGIQTC